MLRYQDVLPSLERVSSIMKSDGLKVDLVAYLGNRIPFLGEHFSKIFAVPKTELPSLLRPNRNPVFAHVLNTIYPYVPEEMLRLLSEQYKRIYQRDDRVLRRDFNLERVVNGYKSILLVDDNAFTGKTFENWKRIIGERARVHTFSITITGDYHPDYFCLEGWHSFEWRPIGI